MDSLRTMLLCVPAVRTQWHCRRATVGSLNFSISFRFRHFDWRFQPTVGGSNQRLEDAMMRLRKYYDLLGSLTSGCAFRFFGGAGDILVYSRWISLLPSYYFSDACFISQPGIFFSSWHENTMQLSLLELRHWRIQ